MSNNKAKGELSQLEVILRLFKAGLKISIPYGDNQRYDLILDDGALKRVQIKSGRVKDKKIEFSACSTGMNTKITYRKSYVGEIDLFAVWVPEISKLYLIPIEDVKIQRLRYRYN